MNLFFKKSVLIFSFLFFLVGCVDRETVLVENHLPAAKEENVLKEHFLDQENNEIQMEFIPSGFFQKVEYQNSTLKEVVVKVTTTSSYENQFVEVLSSKKNTSANKLRENLFVLSSDEALNFLVKDGWNEISGIHFDMEVVEMKVFDLGEITEGKKHLATSEVFSGDPASESGWINFQPIYKVKLAEGFHQVKIIGNKEMDFQVSIMKTGDFPIIVDNWENYEAIPEESIGIWIDGSNEYIYIMPEITWSFADHGNIRLEVTKE